MITTFNAGGESDLYLNGQMLVAMPGMPDERFERTVIFICAHSKDGAMGFVVNRPADDMTFSDLLAQLKIGASESNPTPGEVANLPVLRGGPVEVSRGFVLHADHADRHYGSVAVTSEIRMSASIEILHAIARGEGPDRAVFALGYAGWGAGQLESELQDNGWICCPTDPDILFDTDFATKYSRALQRIGIDAGRLSAQAGHA